ncbi:QacE family quaternary ammonium compound efflux SMR transporter [Paenibacillus sp. FSL R5-0490]|uniref:DMT family transporter n=1 Tax=Bacillales TaxID=1385 RepID=UPI00096EBC19|nr:multidrug efflux SMR transporter [Paenibacillus sp. FSL R5-0490]OMF56827.1 QacE family quaternary ammonium compound efflux SMR transporter [Paenibacillus sp. FSL R5-0490]
MNAYFLLALAIVSEVAGSSLLKAADGFKKLLPSIGVIIGYSVAFYALSLSLKSLPLGVAYAVWAGLGTVLTALVGIFIYKENANGKKLLGLALIVGGVILLNSSGGH